MCHRSIAADPVHADTIEALKAELVEWRRSIARESEYIGDEPLQWRAELGNPTVVDSYFSGYMRQFRRLVSVDGHRPGRTGPAAAKVLESIGNTN